MRVKVEQLLSQNDKLKGDVDSLDNQIGLLVRNLISAQVYFCLFFIIFYGNYKQMFLFK